MPKKPEADNQFEYTGVIELTPDRFEKVSDEIKEAKSYLSLAANNLVKSSLGNTDGIPGGLVRSAIGHLKENLAIAGKQAVNLNNEAASALDILSWIAEHGQNEASGIVPTGPLSATAWHNRQVKAVDIQQDDEGESLYLAAWQRAQMRLNLTRKSVETETF